MGEKVIEDVKLVNILSDVCSLDEFPAANSILKKMLTDGYGSEIMAIVADPAWEVRLKVLESIIVSQNGYRDDITKYIVESFAYGLGKIEKEPKAVSDVNNPFTSMADLELELKKLKGEYITFLEDNVLTAEGQPVSFLTNDKSEIYEYREKINLLNEALGKTDSTWCDDRMKEVLDKHSRKAETKQKKSFINRLFGSKLWG